MTMLNAYIGDLSDPGFQWEGGNWNGNVPRQQSPELVGSFFEIVRAIRSGRYPGKQTDFGGWVACVTKQQLLEFVEQHEGACPDAPEIAASAAEPPADESAALRHWFQTQKIERLQRTYAFLSTLEERKYYALVATEL